MPKQIITHPDNMKILQELFQKKFQDKLNKDICQYSDHLHFINHDVKSFFNIQENKYMEKDRWSGKWRVKENKFYSYWDGVGEPPSWCIYCGFVEKVMEPNFVEMNEPISYVNKHRMYFDFGNIKYDDRALLINASV